MRKLYILFCLILTACPSMDLTDRGAPAPVATRAPTVITDNFYYPGFGVYGDTNMTADWANPLPTKSGEYKKIAVILPETGANAALGQSIKRGVEIALLQKNPANISAEFYDLTGDYSEKNSELTRILATNPDIVIGPLFAEDAELIRGIKPRELPVLSLTSDARAIGNNVMTMSVMPTQATEKIVQQIAADGRNKMTIIAPDDAAGYMMANAALDAADINGIKTYGLYYYAPGNTDSMRAAAARAAMAEPRARANTRAKEILSDILLNKNIDGPARISAEAQLETLKNSDTVGVVPYDSVLFLGTAEDSKTIASFLRYYDVSQKTAGFYGTAMWDSDLLYSDIVFANAKYAALPTASADFASVYNDAAGAAPDRMSGIAYDATVVAINALRSDNGAINYLTDPSGFRGIDGIFRLSANGESERALQVMQLNASGAPRVANFAATDFIRPLYHATTIKTRKPREVEITGGYNAMSFIEIPSDLRRNYDSVTYRGSDDATPMESNEVIILPEDDSDPIITEDYVPQELDDIGRTAIDQVEIKTRTTR